MNSGQGTEKPVIEWTGEEVNGWRGEKMTPSIADGRMQAVDDLGAVIFGSFILRSIVNSKTPIEKPLRVWSGRGLFPICIKYDRFE